MRRRPRILVRSALVALLLATVASCGRDDAGDDGRSSSAADASTTTAGAVAGEAGAPSSSASAPGGPTTTATGAPRGGASPTTTTTRRSTTPPTTASPGAGPGGDGDGGGGGTAPAPGSASAPPTAADDGHTGPPGAFARTLLRAQPATAVTLERQQQSGAAPASSSFGFARDTFQRVTQKPVAAPTAIAIAGGARSWSADDLRALADAGARAPQGGTSAVIRLLFVHGSFEGKDDVLGVTVRGDVVAIFTDAVDGASTPVLSGDTIEEAVLVHELGHVLGLVDLARNTGRSDKDHPGHSTNPRSVMYWAVESSLIGQVLSGPPPRDFDAADLADLDALRNGA